MPSEVVEDQNFPSFLATTLISYSVIEISQKKTHQMSQWLVITYFPFAAVDINVILIVIVVIS